MRNRQTVPGYTSSTVVITLVLLVVIGLLIWYCICQMSLDAIRLILVSSLILHVPLCYMAWYLGNAEAKGTVSGIEIGVRSVVSAAGRTSSATDQTRATRIISRQLPTLPDPDVDIVHRQSSGCEIIEI